MKYFFSLAVISLSLFSVWTTAARAQVTCLEAAQQSNPGLLLSGATCVTDPVKDCTAQPGGNLVQQTVQECGSGVCCAFIMPSNLQTGTSGTPSKDLSVNTFCFPDPFSMTCGGEGIRVEALVQRIISAVLTLVGALFFIFFLWGGVRYLTAGGDAESVKKAQKILVNAVIGMGIIGLSYAIVTTIINTIVAGSAAR